MLRTALRGLALRQAQGEDHSRTWSQEKPHPELVEGRGFRASANHGLSLPSRRLRRPDDHRRRQQHPAQQRPDRQYARRRDADLRAIAQGPGLELGDGRLRAVIGGQVVGHGGPAAGGGKALRP
ncbi:hypothetical protein SGCZBJ_06945 [Caulobacter zeae]|uniref:Uncharacterized protein n=1 Tax=Caulobacter zeae TaxID=2055137 RepID=A0A2N5DNL7_9CAUL|nr:hypothetical protein SGCZBJ_06945 [Caulobacter zeae]